MSTWVEVVDDGEVVDVLDEEDCCIWYGAPDNDRCGGCESCLLMQCAHSGYLLRPRSYGPTVDGYLFEGSDSYPTWGRPNPPRLGRAS